MLIICDSAETYKTLGMIDEEIHDHIEIAEPSQVRDATLLVSEMTKILADSLVNNWEHYDSFEESSRKKMLTRMKAILTEENKVKVPVYKLEDNEAPKLYVIDYSALYQDNEEGKKYIHDPFPALIKSAVNLSAYINNRDCKLLPACACLQDGDKSDVSSVDILDVVNLAELRASEKASVGPLVHEIQFRAVSDDEGEEQEHDADGSASVCSDLTA